MTTIISSRQLRNFIERTGEEKELNGIKTRAILLKKTKWLHSKHVFRLALGVELSKKVINEDGDKSFIKNNHFIGNEVIMTGFESTRRNKALEDKFYEKLDSNPNAKLMRWLIIKQYVD